ncbi:MAG: translation elongation factor-like protein [Chloroflexi bacterium]|nr:translation elongation factor-like protein [Chloroflexota bacterium]
MSEGHDPNQAIGQVSHYFGHLSVAAVSLKQPLALGDRIHVVGHTTDLVQEVRSMQIDHVEVQEAKPGDDVAIAVDDHVREHDLIYRES